MFPIERRQAILDYLEVNTTATVDTLAKTLYIGEATIRRDLEYLASTGQLVRTHGGAMKILSSSIELPFDFRQNTMIRQKEQIISKALELINDGDTLFLDSSSTVLRLTQKLGAYKNLVVITNGIYCALECTKLGIRTICTSGTLENRSTTLIGQSAVDMIESFFVDKFIFSCRAISDDFVIYEPSRDISLVKRAMLKNSKKNILLLDYSKMHSTAFSKSCSLSDVNCLVTDYVATEKLKDYILEHNIEMINC